MLLISGHNCTESRCSPGLFAEILSSEVVLKSVSENL